MSTKDRVEADSVAPQKIGVHDFDSLKALLETTFYRLNGLISDPQDTIQLMEAEILRLRRDELQGVSVSISCPALNIATMEPPDDDPTAGIAPVVSHTQESTKSVEQQPPQQKKKYYVRLTVESAEEIQPSPVNFPTEVLKVRLCGPISFVGANIMFGNVEPFLKSVL